MLIRHCTVLCDCRRGPLEGSPFIDDYIATSEQVGIGQVSCDSARSGKQASLNLEVSVLLKS